MVIAGNTSYSTGQWLQLGGNVRSDYHSYVNNGAHFEDSVLSHVSTYEKWRMCECVRIKKLKLSLLFHV